MEAHWEKKECDLCRNWQILCLSVLTAKRGPLREIKSLVLSIFVCFELDIGIWKDRESPDWQRTLNSKFQGLYFILGGS